MKIDHDLMLHEVESIEDSEELKKVMEKAKEEAERDILAKEKKDLENFDVYLYALASVERKHQSELLIKFINSNFEIDDEDAFYLQQSYLNAINLYRSLKVDQEYKNPDNSINFDKLALKISKDMRVATFISDGNLFIKGKLIKKDSDGNVYLTRNIIELPNLKFNVIKHIIERISEWETQEK